MGSNAPPSPDQCLIADCVIATNQKPDRTLKIPVELEYEMHQGQWPRFVGESASVERVLHND